MRASLIAVAFVLAAYSINLVSGQTVATSAAAPATAASGPADAAWVAASFKELGLAPAVEKIQAGKGGDRVLGEVNWTTGEVIAIGEGRMQGRTGQQLDMAMRAARLVAARNAILLLAGVRPGPGGTFGDLRNADIKVDAVLKGFREVGTDYNEKNNTAVVKLAAPLWGAQGLVQLSGATLREPGSPGLSMWPTTPGRAVEAIVIDARGTGVVPSAFARVVTDDGVMVPSGKPDPKLGRGPVVWAVASDIGKSRKPFLIVTAGAANASDPATIRLGKDAAGKIGVTSIGGMAAVCAGKVIVIIDPPQPASAPAK